MPSRKTIASPVTFQGKGVHSGIPCSLSILPAPSGTGLQFSRTDLPGSPKVPAHESSIVRAELARRTTLAQGDAKVHTVEHVLSAAYALGLTDALLEMDAPEPPFLDGSSLPFFEMLHATGLTELPGECPSIHISRPLVFQSDGVEICALPDSQFRVSFFYNSEHPKLRSQAYTTVVTPQVYHKEIAPARTFCFFEEIELMQKVCLIKGASLSSAVVIGRKHILNESLRFDDEPVRHKILDFIGDLSLVGAPVTGHFLAWKAGHRANAAFVEFLIKELGL